MITYIFFKNDDFDYEDFISYMIVQLLLLIYFLYYFNQYFI